MNIKVRLFYTFESQYGISYFTIVKESPHILYLYNNVNFANVDAFFYIVKFVSLCGGDVGAGMWRDQPEPLLH